MVVFVISQTVTVEDKRYPEMHPIHRHDVFGVASDALKAGELLREAIKSAGFVTSQYDTRIRKTHPTYITQPRNHIRDISETYEWMVERYVMDEYDKRQ